jgi:adenosylhomocysteinase
MSFANQALCIEYMVNRKKPLPVQVYPVAEEIDKRIATEKLETMNISIDTLTTQQKRYLASWDMGT